ncbi:MAG: hypothetical protein QXX45_03340 [Candidatus Aenigmatarchaeota archaeon]
MIIFYNKKTGQIVGTIEGRIHQQDHLNMWIGDKNETDRIVVQWKPVKWYDAQGREVDKNSPNVFTADFEPDHQQKDIFIEIDKNPIKVYDYRVDINSKLLVKK